MKKMISVFLAAVLLLTALSSAFAMVVEDFVDTSAGFPKTMYVYTEDHGKLNVRTEPRKGDNVCGQVEYGSAVTVEGLVAMNSDWAVIQFKKGVGGIGYVMTRYLVNSKPSGSPKQSSEKTADKQKKEADQRKADLEELNRQLKSARPLETPLMISVRASRASGWVNFRVGPGVAADRVASLPDGRELKAIGETDKWYQAIDQETGKTGYVSKNYVTVLGPVKEEPAAPAKEQMGKLNVNGEFALQCQLPEGYTMQLINTLGTKISALITSQDTEKPILQLSIAFDEVFADAERMNDLSQDALKGLEESFAEMNDVEITYTKTAYGTLLLVAREVGDDTDFVDILSVYKGYSIEFVMSPNPSAKNQTLTDAQVQMCVDFLSELDFIPV
ncbi:MAG: SH3 domain-containing protein [Clostridia bacterium]|nr:SH3 domain-containing protein [Clostridia bacterium]